MTKYSPKQGTWAISTAMAMMLGLIIVLLFLLGNIVIKNWQTERQFRLFADQNEQLQVEQTQLNKEFRYNNSPQAMDKWAKQNAGLTNPGEQVIVLMQPEIPLYDQAQDNTPLSPAEQIANKSNRQQWRIFFFGQSG